MPLGRLGKYEKVDILGHGTSGLVYLAWDTLLKKQVALKEIDLQAADMERFLEEARVMDRLRHPNIVRVNGVDRIDGHVVIDMEYVKGANLQELLRREGRLAVDRALEIAIQMLDALDYAHAMRTVHRDIKPANILISRDGTVRLVDFGLAEILATNSYAGGAGTYAYMAPEDFAEEQRSDHQSDIWAAGVTVFEMLTGARPFNVEKSRDPFAWRRVLLNEPPARLRDFLGEVPAGLQEALDRSLARDKRERYSTAGAFRDSLRAVCGGSLEHEGAARPIRVERQHAANPERNGSNPVAVESRTVVLEIPASPPFMPILPALAAAPATTPLVPAVSGVVTAAPAAPIDPLSRVKRLIRRESRPGRVVLSQTAIDFGEARKGEQRRARLSLRLIDGDAQVSAAVSGAPPWLEVSPRRFDRRRQTLTLTADSAHVWQTGSFEDAIRLETSCGPVELPVRLRVLPARPRFSEVASWYLPLFATALLPALTVGFLAHAADVRYLVPAAALGSGLLAAMMLMAVTAANLGTEERIACGVAVAIMTALLGLAAGAGRSHADVFTPLWGTGVPIGFLFSVQAFTRRRWRVWCGIIAALGLLSAYSFLSAVIP